MNKFIAIWAALVGKNARGLQVIAIIAAAALLLAPTDWLDLLWLDGLRSDKRGMRVVRVLLSPKFWSGVATVLRKCFRKLRAWR